MSRVCEVCERGAKTGNKISHSHRVSTRKFSINLQTKKVDGDRLKVCTRCIKTLSKTK